MKLFDSVGPNPRLVRMFLAEKGLSVPVERIDWRVAQNRQSDYLKRNPLGQIPTLELDDGTYISEVTAICEYFEEICPTPALIGNTPQQRAECRMWTRRIDLNICEPLTNGFRFSEGLRTFQDRIICLPEAAPGLKMIAADRIRWLDGQVGDKEFICGSRFSLADMILYCWIDFGNKVGQPLDQKNMNLDAWFRRMSGRPSARA